MSLMIGLRVGEAIRVGSGANVATITLEQKHGQRATLKIDADKSVPIEKIANPVAPIVARVGVRTR